MAFPLTRLVAAAATVGALLPVGAAFAKDPQQAYLERTLKAAMTKTYAKAAPGLTIVSVTCPLPKSEVVHTTCTANFTAGSTVSGAYKVKADFLSSGMVNWTAGSPFCKNTKTGKKISC
ncbi:MAG: hypothetical protein WCH31_01420 [Actinomycetes bacterium]